ncbi:MAG TPA: nuclear transport factor 2 family protein [Pyrinomonadaceae bacterium]|nr:nuclear transport factor 2 family protein [Pyrinomonadaceae bacterium]
MIYRLAFIIAVVLAAATLCVAQNSNTSAPPASRPRTQSTPPPSPAQTQQGNTGAQTTDAGQGRTGRRSTANDLSSKGVVDAFDSLIAGIEKADVSLVTNVYWNSQQLVLFNYNGTVTRSWEQMRKNRESSYPNLKDVKLAVRDRRVLMLGRDAAMVTCLWTQTQTYKGTPETASGRMTLVFQRINGAWKAVHLHTSPDAPDPSRLPASEQTTTTPAKP